MRISFAALGIYKHFQINNKILDYKNELDRILQTENETIFLKENSGILILHKDHHSKSKPEYKSLEKSIVGEKKKGKKNFKHSEHCENIKYLQHFEATQFRTNGIDDNCKLKVVVLNDDLFDGLTDDEGIVKEESKQIVIDFFNKLSDYNIGLVLFGKTKLADFSHPYLAFANQPYSVYANLNNLLKYMRVAENINVK